MLKYFPRPRPGRPAGPTKGRGQRHYDPKLATEKQWRIIRAVHRYRPMLNSGDMRYCELANYLGTSVSYMSIVKNSRWGQSMLQYLEILEGAGIQKRTGPDQ